MSRRQTLALGAAAMLAPRAVLAASSRPVLVELFTSQGCSSCPAADKFASELVNDPDTILLSFNVDYWDYLGWRDTLAKPEYTERQYAYAKARGDGSVYTPQMVINGTTHAVGSDKAAVEKQIAAGRVKALAVDVGLTLTGKSITVELPATTVDGDVTLWLMAVEARVEQKIERGENSGKNIVYVNVVRNMVPATMWNGAAYKGSWMRDVVMTKGSTTCIAVLQKGKAGPVLGLARS